MIPEKVVNFIGSDEYDRDLEDLAKFLGFGWDDKRMSTLISWFNEVLRENKKGDDLKKITHQFLGFLDPEKLNYFLSYFNEKLGYKINNLWEEEERPKSPEILISEDTFEEREKKYLKLMEEILKLKQKEKETFQKIDKELQEFEEISKPERNTAKEEKLQKTPSEILVVWGSNKEKEFQELPEGTIVIKKKEDAEIKNLNESEDVLDLSKL